MREHLANLVYPVFQHGLRVKDALEQREPLDLANEQARLRGLLKSDMLEGDEGTESDRFLGIRYGLVCWLDEVFILDSPWKAEWTERKLEQALYGISERAWKFWEQARMAEARGNADALEVFFLCVMLGFRGDLRDEPQRLKAWREQAQAQIARARPEFAPPPAQQPPTNVPPLEGAARRQKMVVAWAVSLLLLTPVVVFLLVSGLGR
jgi:type VI secretion system protein ImpK